MVSLDSSNSTTITTFTTTHCCSSGGSRSAAAGESRCGRGGGATEEGNGWAGGDNGSEAAHKTASVRQALTGSKTWQSLADGYRSAHQGKSFSGLPMNVLPGVSRESDGGHEVTDFGLSIKLKRQRSVPVGNGASRKSDIPNEVGDTFSDVQRAEGADG